MPALNSRQPSSQPISNPSVPASPTRASNCSYPLAVITCCSRLKSKGQKPSKLQSTSVLCNDAKHDHELRAKNINSKMVKERSITEAIFKIRLDIQSNPQDLSSIQQLENQTKLRIDTIERNLSCVLVMPIHFGSDSEQILLYML